MCRLFSYCNRQHTEQRQKIRFPHHFHPDGSAGQYRIFQQLLRYLFCKRITGCQDSPGKPSAYQYIIRIIQIIRCAYNGCKTLQIIIYNLYIFPVLKYFYKIILRMLSSNTRRTCHIIVRSTRRFNTAKQRMSEIRVPPSAVTPKSKAQPRSYGHNPYRMIPFQVTANSSTCSSGVGIIRKNDRGIKPPTQPLHPLLVTQRRKM